MIVSKAEVVGALVSAGRFPREDGSLKIRPDMEEIGRCRLAIAMLPYVRRERVEALRYAVVAKLYKIDVSEVAGKMVDRSLLDVVLTHVVLWP